MTPYLNTPLMELWKGVLLITLLKQDWSMHAM